MFRQRVQDFAATSIISSVLFFVQLLISELINYEVTTPYMDEEFHVPQTQQYCKGDLSSYNSSITTPPGLYILAASIHHTFVSSLLEDDSCRLEALRGFNAVLISPFLFTVIFWIVTHTQTDMPLWKRIARSLRVYTLPFLFFFNFLFYTDALSTLFLLTCYFLHMINLKWMGLFIGLSSVMVRQTNIVWVCLIGALEAFPIISMSIRSIFLRTYRYIVVALLFVAFVFVNRGIALGDKANHQFSFHTAQIVYLLSVIQIVMGPLSCIKMFVNVCKLEMRGDRSFNRHVLALLAALHITLSICILIGTVAHPFILSDNRHYTFYLWKRLLGVDGFRVIVLPALVAFSILFSNTYSSLIPPPQTQRKIDSPTWERIYSGTLFWIGSTATLVLSPLIEFRYFIIPVVIFLIHRRDKECYYLKFGSLREILPSNGSDNKLMSVLRLLWSVDEDIECVICHLVCNALLIYMFLYQTFESVDGTIGRFMF